ncbi:LacI family DNA-binding transcriptional regulator [Mediterraneibacter gnavus]|uniref:LacI family DNA-binding transcriptional regulator n=1 Tax=Mediterraneibacter gnavus TaxID=33038 RepID=UPI00232CB832|nr:LacI family DNA-binding transcriptional regulator [Mediterraneibacter gnavus]MDB8709583.1 LacI family DNA-binding transcriptional regulator [Mediterraneibacter gnavus]MDB8712349.1 LacI family DNA-binding transcriptional regulator [Mediterraneibacter gnavus]
MAATIRDVAKKSGLSLGTVSKYINGHPVKETNRLLIEQAIQELQYKPNNIAKGLRNSQTFSVAVLLPMLTSNFCTSMISSIESYLLPKGYTVIVCECHNDAAMELQKARFLLDRMVDGIILIPYDSTGKQIELIQNNHTPLIVVDQIIKDHPSDTIILDNQRASYEPVKKLISLGHTKIAIITGGIDHYTSQQRLNGYEKALRECHLPIYKHYIQCGNYSTEGGYEAMMKLAKLPDPPTAVFISNYDMEIGAYIGINNLNLKIPEDISLIGFDNLPLVNIVNPPLSFSEQPTDEMGLAAAKLLYRRMQGDQSDYPKTLIHAPIFHYTDSICSPLDKERVRL